MGFYGICVCVAGTAYWYHAGDELGYPGWLGAAVAFALFLCVGDVLSIRIDQQPTHANAPGPQWLEMNRHRRRAIATDACQEAALGRRAERRLRVLELRQVGAQGIVFARLERERPLADGGQHLLGRDALAHTVCETEAVEA